MIDIRKAGRALRPAVLISLLLLLCTLCGCATDLIGDPADLSKFEQPVGMAIHPNGRYAYVTGSNFDLNYRATDGGALYVVDLQTGSIVSAKRMGSFATNVVLSHDARRGYTVTRGDDALVWFSISENGSSISCPEGDEESESLLDCRVILDNDPSGVSITRSSRGTGSDAVEFDLLVVGQLKEGRVSAITARDTEDGVAFSHQSAAMQFGASDVIHLGGERFAVTGRAASNLIVVAPALDAKANVKGLYLRENVSVPNASAYQGRGMALDPSGQSLFLVNQSPNSILRFELPNVGRDVIQNTQTTLLPTACARVIWVGDQDSGVLYVTSVTEDTIYILDPVSLEIINTVKTGRGPYEMAIHGNTLYLLLFAAQAIVSYDVSDPIHPTVAKTIIGSAVEAQ